MFVSLSTIHNLFSARNRRNFVLPTAIFVLCFLFNVSGVYAATFVVNSTVDANDVTAGNGVCETAAGNGVCTLRAAITEANALAGDDIITLPAGTYTNTLVGVNDTNVSGDLDINSNITINGAGSGTTFIEAATTAGTAVERVFHTTTANVTVVISGVTIRNGRQPLLTAAALGGGVRINAAGDSYTFNNCIISNNFSGSGGGGILINNATASVMLNNTTVTGNTFSGSGGGASGGGGVLLNGGGTLTATNSTISTNIATSTAAPYGGGIENFGGTVTLASSTISGNMLSTTGTANAFGGGIDNDGSGTVTLTNSTISGNTVTSAGTVSAVGGAISHFTGTINITGSVISNNSATATGTGSAVTGGIYTIAALTLTNSTVSGNTSAFHAGIRTGTGGTTTINNSAVVNNTALGSEGGGVVNASSGATNATTNINNSTIGGNMAAGDAAGVENFATAAGNAIVNINYSTVAGNAANTDNAGAESGGGIGNFGQVSTGTGVGTITVTSSIVADNTIGTGGIGPDIFGVITSGNYNHVENLADGTFAPMANDVTGIDPGLTPLALNGGTTLSYQPATGSPVLDTIPGGTNGCGIAPFIVDQRGAVRPTNSNNDGVPACEKGSVEVIAPTAAATSVGGRVLMGSSLKRGLANATVTMTDGAGVVRMTRTNPYGYFQFTDVEAGQTYLFNVAAKRYQFQTQVVSVNNDLTDLTFMPLNYLGLE